MPRYRYTTTIVRKGIVDAEDEPLSVIENTAIADTLAAFEFDALDVIYAVELEPLTEADE